VCSHARVERQRHRRRRRTRRQTRRSIPSLKIGSVSTTFALPLAARRYIHVRHPPKIALEAWPMSAFRGKKIRDVRQRNFRGIIAYFNAFDVWRKIREFVCIL